MKRATRKATIQPRDSATLIIVRFDGAVPRVLMGQRHQGHVFMPGKYVFPGGRVERADGLARSSMGADPITIEKLTWKMRGKPSLSRARGLLVAAVRETLEETGLRVGHRKTHDVPDLTGIVYFARAITPPGNNRRFDSRFFVCDACLVANLDDPSPLEFDELLAVKWVTLEEALALNIPSITRDVLQLLAPHLVKGRLPSKSCPVSFQYSQRAAWIVEVLDGRKT